MKRLVNEVTTAFARTMTRFWPVTRHFIAVLFIDIESGINRAKELARDKIFEHPQKQA